MDEKDKKIAKRLSIAIKNNANFLEVEVYKGNKGNINEAIRQIEIQLSWLKMYFNLL